MKIRELCQLQDCLPPCLPTRRRLPGLDAASDAGRRGLAAGGGVGAPGDARLVHLRRPERLALTRARVHALRRLHAAVDVGDLVEVDRRPVGRLSGRSGGSAGHLRPSWTLALHPIIARGVGSCGGAAEVLLCGPVDCGRAGVILFSRSLHPLARQASLLAFAFGPAAGADGFPASHTRERSCQAAPPPVRPARAAAARRASTHCLRHRHWHPRRLATLPSPLSVVVGRRSSGSSTRRGRGRTTRNRRRFSVARARWAATEGVAAGAK